jgi:hypothetical protein
MCNFRGIKCRLEKERGLPSVYKNQELWPLPIEFDSSIKRSEIISNNSDLQSIPWHCSFPAQPNITMNFKSILTLLAVSVAAVIAAPGKTVMLDLLNSM